MTDERMSTRKKKVTKKEKDPKDPGVGGFVGEAVVWLRARGLCFGAQGWG